MLLQRQTGMQVPKNLVQLNRFKLHDHLEPSENSNVVMLLYNLLSLVYELVQGYQPELFPAVDLLFIAQVPPTLPELLPPPQCSLVSMLFSSNCQVTAHRAWVSPWLGARFAMASTKTALASPLF